MKRDPNIFFWLIAKSMTIVSLKYVFMWKRERTENEPKKKKKTVKGKIETTKN